MKNKTIKYVVIPTSLLVIGGLFGNKILDSGKKAGIKIIQKINTINEREQQKALDYLIAQTDTLSLFIEPDNPIGVDKVFYSQYFDYGDIYPENLRDAYRQLFLEENNKSTLDLIAGVPVMNYTHIQGSINNAIQNYVNKTRTRTAVFRVFGKDGTEQFRRNHQSLLDKGLKPVRDPR